MKRGQKVVYPAKWDHGRADGDEGLWDEEEDRKYIEESLLKFEAETEPLKRV